MQNIPPTPPFNSGPAGDSDGLPKRVRHVREVLPEVLNKIRAAAIRRAQLEQPEEGQQ